MAKRLRAISLGGISQSADSIPRHDEPGVEHLPTKRIAVVCGCINIASEAQLRRNSVWLLNLTGDKAPPAAHDISEVARISNGRCYPHTGNGEHSWCFSSSLSLPVGFSIQTEAMDVARSAQQGGHYQARATKLEKRRKQEAYVPTPTRYSTSIYHTKEGSQLMILQTLQLRNIAWMHWENVK